MSWGRGLCGLEALGLRTNFHEGLGTVIAQRQGMRWENKRLQMAAWAEQGRRVGSASREVRGRPSWAPEVPEAFLPFLPAVL